MKRIMIALAVGLTLFALVAAAATLGGITSASLGASGEVVTSCDTNGVSVAYQVGYQNGVGYVVTAVQVSSIDALCDGKAVDVTLTQSGNSIGSGSGTASGGTTGWIAVPAWPLASQVNDVHVAVHD